MNDSVTPPSGRRLLSAPYAALAGFLLLLAAAFALAYQAGSLAGPVAPDMRGVPHDDAPGGGGMGGLGGMDHGGGH
ncbi:hypothetical protein [Streptomyces sp. WMMB303]|uniref:hypothetical protein n=1 Tax=Streptomyces sp. WMMB303 TaxID=3034154 RepID=UPI0023EB5FB7|nr:hypothetical protein [Streptomyces sp. WMMB303]MDF4248803.1 hypothetical protein [Streptomyces sp. WMMB303]